MTTRPIPATSIGASSCFPPSRSHCLQRGVEVFHRDRAQPVRPFRRVSRLRGVENAADVAAPVRDHRVSPAVLQLELPPEELAVERACRFGVGGDQVVPDELTGKRQSTRFFGDRRERGAWTAAAEQGAQSEDDWREHPARPMKFALPTVLDPGLLLHPPAPTVHLECKPTWQTSPRTNTEHYETPHSDPHGPGSRVRFRCKRSVIRLVKRLGGSVSQAPIEILRTSLPLSSLHQANRTRVSASGATCDEVTPGSGMPESSESPSVGLRASA